MDGSAHNEILAFLLVVLGMNLLIGGLIVAILVVGEPNIFPFLTQQEPLDVSTALGLVLTVAGFILVSAGFVLVVHYDRARSWFSSEIEKSDIHRKKKTDSKAINEILEEYGYKKERS